MIKERERKSGQFAGQKRGFAKWGPWGWRIDNWQWTIDNYGVPSGGNL